MHSFFNDFDDDYRSAPDTSDMAYGQDARLAYQPRLAQWILLIATGAGGMPAYSADGAPDLARLAEITGVAEWADPQSKARDVGAALHQAAKALPAQLVQVGPCIHRSAVQWLAQGAGLDNLEQNILELALALRSFGPLVQAAQMWSTLDYGSLVQGVAVLLYSHPRDVAQALMPQGQLQRSALVTLNSGSALLKPMLQVPRNISARLALIEQPQQLLSHILIPMPQASCQLSDFDYMTPSTQLARSWLMGALHCAQAQGHAGHLLVSGSPGLGKTEWVRALVAEVLASVAQLVLNKDLAHHPVNGLANELAHELVVHDIDGSPMSGNERLDNLRLVLQLKRNSPNTVLIFDEADDVFKSSEDVASLGAGDSDAVSMRNHRASLNRLIEDSPLPVIWIMNRPEVLDPAVLRRFDAVIAFERMPRAVKRALLLSRGVADEYYARLWSQLAPLTPALIDRLAHVQRSAQAAGWPMDVGLSQHWLRQRLTSAQDRQLLGRAGGSGSVGGPGVQTGDGERPVGEPAAWQADQVHASQDLDALVQGIGQWGQARILLHGKPGTGKTAFAHALAEGIDRPLLTKRASDLLSAYVGETEQRIRTAFEEADDDDAVLFIDEVDSLLAQRSQAVRTWEVSQVNELLQHLGEFDGVVVLATNRLDALDPAVIRRMDVRVAFKSLRPEQSQLSFQRLCGQLRLPCPGQALHLISQIMGLTPGDFALVARRWRFSPEAGACAPDLAAEQLARWLREECQFRGQDQPSIGFLADWASSVF